MGYPKQPGQDAEAHRRLAEEHLAVLQERDTLRADLATLKAENARQKAEIGELRNRARVLDVVQAHLAVLANTAEAFAHECRKAHPAPSAESQQETTND